MLVALDIPMSGRQKVKTDNSNNLLSKLASKIDKKTVNNLQKQDKISELKELENRSGLLTWKREKRIL